MITVSPRKGSTNVAQALTLAAQTEELENVPQADINHAKGLVRAMFSEENIDRALSLTRELAEWHRSPVVYSAPMALSSSPPKEVVDTIQQYQRVIDTVNRTLLGEVVEMWFRVQFYDLYSDLQRQLKEPNSQVWEWAQTRPKIRGKNRSAWLLDELARQLTSSSPDDPLWKTNRDRLKNDVTLSGVIHTLVTVFGQGILPLLPPRSRDT